MYREVEENTEIYHNINSKEYFEMQRKLYKKEQHNNRKIAVTDYGTIVGKKFNEISVDEFVGKLSKNIESNEYNVTLLDEDMKYQITYGGVDYYLSIDNINNNKTLIECLKKLSIKENKINEKISNTEKEMNRKKELLEKAEKGIIETDEARELYIDYLSNSKKFSLKKVKKYFSNLKEDIEESLDNADEILDKIFPVFADFGFFSKTVVLLICGSIINLVIPFIIMFIVDELSFIQAVSYFIPMLTALAIPTITYLTMHIKNRMQRLIQSIKNRKLVNHKIAMLLNSKKKENELESKTEKALNETIDEKINLNEITLKTIALNEINGATNKLVYINVEDRKQLYIELKSLLNEFNERMMKIEEASKSGISSITLGDSEEKLKVDVISKIGEIEARILDIRKRDMIKNQIAIESKKVEESLDEVMNYEKDFTSNGVAYQKRSK